MSPCSVTPPAAKRKAAKRRVGKGCTRQRSPPPDFMQTWAEKMRRRLSVPVQDVFQFFPDFPKEHVEAHLEYLSHDRRHEPAMVMISGGRVYKVFLPGETDL